MMLTPQETALTTSVAAFAATEVTAHAPNWSMGEAPNPGLFRYAAELGLTGMEVPENLGGLGFGFAFKAQVCRLLAAVDFGFAMSIVNTANVAARLAKSAPQALRERYLPGLLTQGLGACTALTEPGTGSDFTAVETRAERANGGWVLTGKKTWITNARRASLALVYAQCETAGDPKGIGAFLLPLDTTDCRPFPVDSPFQQTAIGLGGFLMDGCRLPEDHLIIQPGEAFGEIMSEINGARVYVAAMCEAMLEAAIKEAGAYGHRRKTFGKPLQAHQAWRMTLARAVTDLAALSSLVEKAIRLIDGGGDGSSGGDGTETGDAQLLSAQVKIFATETCQRHMPALLHAMGAEGLDSARPFVRHLAAVQLAALADGSTEMLLERVAKRARPSLRKS